MESIEFKDGSKIVILGTENVVRGKGFFAWPDDAQIIKEEITMDQTELKFLDKEGNEQASIPAHSNLLNAIVGYDHDPQTHNYNRSERRRIIKAAKKLEKKYRK